MPANPPNPDEPPPSSAQSQPSEEEQQLAPGRVGPLTVVLIGISIAVAIWSGLGHNQKVLESLFLTANGDGESLPEIRHGQIWRLITPIFIHFGIAHLVFNMIWLKDLGSMIENQVSTGTLLTLVMMSGLLSNLAQFAYAGPLFGGMSGVVYGLFGYVWMKARFDSSAGFRMHAQTVYWMIGWFLLCMTGAMGPVANVAHAGGLMVGLGWGYGSCKNPPGPAEGRV